MRFVEYAVHALYCPLTLAFETRRRLRSTRTRPTGAAFAYANQASYRMVEPAPKRPKALCLKRLTEGSDAAVMLPAMARPIKALAHHTHAKFPEVVPSVPDNAHPTVLKECKKNGSLRHGAGSPLMPFRGAFP
jgi:hypothetical protein